MQMPQVSRGLKIIIGVGITVLLIAGFFFWMWWNDLTIADFFKTPTEVLDETIYYAQEGDEENFKRLFTKESVKGMDEIHIWATGTLESDARKLYEPSDLLTWDMLMEEMAQQGGFEVQEDISFSDRWFEGELTLTIKFGENGKKKAYRMVKEGGVWQIDLTQDPAYGRANTCMSNERICQKRGRHLQPDSFDALTE